MAELDGLRDALEGPHARPEATRVLAPRMMLAFGDERFAFPDLVRFPGSMRSVVCGMASRRGSGIR
jgi:hypothetical protein